MDSSVRSPDVTRVTFQVLALAALMLSSFWILRPFLVPATWATTIVVATWPLLLRAQARFGGRRSLAVAVMTTVLLLVVVLPFYVAVTTLIRNADRFEEWSRAVATMGVPPPPAWVEAVPLIGTKIADRWREVVAAGPAEWSIHVIPALRVIGLWFVGQVGSAALVFLQLLLTVVIAAILYASGEHAAHGAERFARRLAGDRGETAVHLAAQAIRAVALGVVVTAIVQSVLGGLGLVVAGVPFAAVLTALMFVLGVAQIGAAPVLLGATVWVYAKSGAVWGTGFLVWAIFCSVLDNFVRPVLIRRGADLPLLLIFAGVLGGLAAFGIIGLFIGPVVLAVAYTLLIEWIADAPPDRATR